MESPTLEAWEHMTGCPVVTEPTDDNLARVEAYVATNHRTGERKQVTRCTLCGATAYSPLAENGDKP